MGYAQLYLVDRHVASHIIEHTIHLNLILTQTKFIWGHYVFVVERIFMVLIRV
jgi:hypothetical protein